MVNSEEAETNGLKVAAVPEVAITESFIYRSRQFFFADKNLESEVFFYRWVILGNNHKKKNINN